MVFIRGRGPASVHQYIAISDDEGRTWRTELSNIGVRSAHSTLITHPFATNDPDDPGALIAATFERPLPAHAELWRADVQTLKFTHERTLVTLPKIEGNPNDDFGYPWLLQVEGNHWLLFYYHGLKRGDCSIWVTDITL